MIAVPMTMKLFIGFVAFDLFLNLYTVVIVLVILSSLLVSEHIIMISIPMKRELFIGFVYSFSSLPPPLAVGWGWPPIPHPPGGGEQEKRRSEAASFF